MARLARVMAPGMPHHVTQRGNRRQQTFFGEEDYQHYLELISRFCRAEQVAIWAYCLMPNHVHLIVVPQSAESLRRAIGEAHRLYTVICSPALSALILHCSRLLVRWARRFL